MATLKLSTTYTRTFMMIDASDHVTGKTGLTVTVTLSKAGGSYASAGGTVTEIANGAYKIALTTTDSNTLGDLAFHCTASGADPTDFVDQVTANILGDTLPINAGSVWDVTLASHLTSGTTGNALNASGAAGDPWTTTLPGAYGAGTAGFAIGTYITGNAYTRLGAPAGASVSADVAAVKSDTSTILTDVNTGAGAIYTRLGAPTGASIAADIAAVAGGVWDVTLPGSYGSGTAGHIIGSNLTGDAYTRLGSPVGASISADIAGVPTTVWAKVIETGYTGLQAMRLMLSVLCGKSSGVGTGSPVYRDVNDTANRVSGTVDGSKNRTSVTLNP